MIIFAALGLIITNFGLTTILTLASPVLLLLYPLAIALIVLIFANNFFNGQRSVYVSTVIGVGIIAIVDAVKEAGIAPEAINKAFGFIPLFESGAGWIITGILGFIVGILILKVRKESVTIINLAGEKVN